MTTAHDPLTVLPANEATWADLEAVMGSRAAGRRCQCQRYKLQRGESFALLGREELEHRLRCQTDPGGPEAETTGLVGYLDGVPVGWCAVEPRSSYPGLLRSARVPWVGRNEDKDDDGVWAVTCLFTRAGYGKRGISKAMAHAAVGYARDRGARALEAYPMLTTKVIDVELHPGTAATFSAAGMTEVSRPSQRRAVMRIEF